LAFRAAPGNRPHWRRHRRAAGPYRLVRNRLAFCQQLASEITTGLRRQDLTDSERNAFVKQLNSPGRRQKISTGGGPGPRFRANR